MVTLDTERDQVLKREKFIRKYKCWLKVYIDPDRTPQEQEDFKELVLAVQYSNTGAYLGYTLTTQLGFRISRVDEKNQSASTGISQFITVLAGLD